MATKSSIEWTEVTWNPVTGCTKISAGCKNCYAEKMAIRLQAMGVEQYKDGFKIKTVNLYLDHIDWVIVGGESGVKARPVKKEWIDFVKTSCEKANVPFFFKQWGKPAFNVNQNDPTINANHPQHAKGGCQLDGEIIRNFPVTLHLEASPPHTPTTSSKLRGLRQPLNFKNYI